MADVESTMGVEGRVEVTLTDAATGEVVSHEVVHNLVTTAGDQYYARKAITDISPSTPSAPTAASGMKLGTGTTAAAKSGAGAALVTYVSGSNVAFDATYPSAAAVGADAGWYANYSATWGAGTATNSAIAEVAIVNDAGTNATSTASNTYARATFTALNKTSDTILTVTWSHKLLGS